MFTVSDFTHIINQLLPEPHAGLLSGILFGTKAQLSYEFKQALIVTGTIHITALSGMNITIISKLIAGILLPVFSRRIAYLLTVFIIIGFVAFVGPSPSIVRAAVMGCLSLVSVIFGRQRRAITLLCIACAGMILFQPSYITDVSFQLSVLATLGIILFAGSNQSNKGNIVSLIKDDVRTTLAAQAFTVPLIAFQFHRISLIAPLANVCIGFLIAPLTILGILLCLLGSVTIYLSIPLSWFVFLILEYIVKVILLLSTIPYASIQL